MRNESSDCAFDVSKKLSGRLRGSKFAISVSNRNRPVVLKDIGTHESLFLYY